MEIWSGRRSNVEAAQQAMVQQAMIHRANCNQAARRGEYTQAMEKI